MWSPQVFQCLHKGSLTFEVRWRNVHDSQHAGVVFGALNPAAFSANLEIESLRSVEQLPYRLPQLLRGVLSLSCMWCSQQAKLRQTYLARLQVMYLTLNQLARAKELPANFRLQSSVLYPIYTISLYLRHHFMWLHVSLNVCNYSKECFKADVHANVSCLLICTSTLNHGHLSLILFHPSIFQSGGSDRGRRQHLHVTSSPASRPALRGLHPAGSVRCESLRPVTLYIRCMHTCM